MYQEIDGKRVEVEGRFKIINESNLETGNLRLETRN